MRAFFLAVTDPGEIPRDTNTSLFTSHVNSGLYIGFTVIGLILVTLVFIQNYRDWSMRKHKTYVDEETKRLATKSANADFRNSTFVCCVILVVFIVVLLKFGLGII